MDPADEPRESAKAHWIAGDQFDPVAGKPQRRDGLARRQAGAFAAAEFSAFVLPSGRCLGAHLKWAGA